MAALLVGLTAACKPDAGSGASRDAGLEAGGPPCVSTTSKLCADDEAALDARAAADVDADAGAAREREASRRAPLPRDARDGARGA